MIVVESVAVSPEVLDSEMRLGPRPLILDVCSPGEFATGHLPGAMNIPLEQLSSRLRDISWSRTLVLVCRSGNRAAIAQRNLADHGLKSRILTGGIQAWIKLQLPLVFTSSSGWALERQVRFVAGLLILAGVVLAFALSPIWIGLAGVIGLGLTASGITGLCPMAMALARMPWNRPRLNPNQSPVAQCNS